MKSIDIAYAFINMNDASLELTNLKLNKLVYYAQVEALRRNGAPLFDDAIEAWQYGPVEPLVYHTFKQYGRGVVASAPAMCEVDDATKGIIRYVSNTYGRLSAFDLVSLSHRKGSAWELVYRSDMDMPITCDAIRRSADFAGFPGFEGTLERGIQEVCASIPNALKLLEDS
ncbi:type II toxin-antitoxin system antitoxin SocA domain-containing protein [Collinsella sp. An2]|uniref:Panacea domain-containing protein n=1 Tax=Collinsella sp. An2 TaxID=1965585 RepID=UPI000B389385|nr:type II toxin-antitoxin system antitoxin SocA domain-containing protein [Collinsella sp. An2]OUP09796.1 hypothetical protein B5F33_04205 [Collinsella sp. An2]